ncbi:AAA domain-containing protein [Nocardiopsis sp. NPDC050513]|uniref:AAA domain-containing protein n=1 Tax=Nocardiopsis sp. NPDC050513 TaxID=3364338 RepID=UPI00379611FE
MVADERTPVLTDVKRLYQFLLNAEELRSKPVRTVDGSVRVLWLDDLPRDAHSVASGLFDADVADCWLRVDRVHTSEPPPLPALLRPWIDPGRVRDHTGGEAPPLRERALTASTGGERADAADAGPAALTAAAAGGEARGHGGAGSAVLTLDDHPDREEITDAHRTWSGTWETWADRERRAAPLIRLYERVYRIHTEAVDLGESYELVLGLGLLTWTAEDQPVRRHLLTRRAVLSMDERGRIELAPDPDGPGYTLEEEMLDASQRVREEPRERIAAELASASEFDGPDGAAHLHAALREWTLAASSDARYDETGARQGTSADTSAARVAFAPAVILRERPKRGEVNALRQITDAVERHTEATPLLRHLVGGRTGAPSDPGSESVEDLPEPGSGTVPVPSAEDELYFALPSNAEQRQIADRLRASDLVVVQGPPGTGKTHTIANLVTDLLARGERVLITSHTTRALKVLKDKLPDQIRPLAVSRTGDGIEAQRELEASVRTILERQADDDPRASRREIDALHRRLDGARGRRDQELKELRSIRERETFHHPRRIGDYEGTLARIAERLAEEEDRHGWIGEVTADRPPVTADRVRGLLGAARAYTPVHRRISAEVPEAARLPAPSGFADALEAIAEADRAASEAAGSWEGDTGALVQGLSRERCAALRARVEDFTAARDLTGRLDRRWDALRAGVLAGREQEARAQADTVRSCLEAAETALTALGGALIEGLDRFGLGQALGFAATLHEGLANGRRIHGVFGLRTRLARDNAAFLDAVTVDGRAPHSLRALEAVRHRIDAERCLSEAARALGADASAESWGEPRTRTARLRDALAALDTLLDLARARTSLIAAATEVPRLAALDWAVDAEVDRVALLLTAADAEHGAAPARASVAGARAELRAWSDRSHPEPPALRRALTAVESGDTEGYAAACAELERVREAARLAAVYEEALDSVARAHPSLARSIADTCDDPAWDTRLAGFDQAWAWSAWNRRLTELTDPAAEERCRARLEEADGEIRLTRAKLAAARAWRACLSRLTRDQEVALRSYQLSVRKIGKGTGKYARVHQQHARESLRECQPAVPAWIMPLYQVVATVPMDAPGAFDVVIVDEASQSGPEALLLAWLGKRLVVVGDDKQVSPANVGIDQEQVFTLQRRHLAAFPASRRNLFSPNRSLFDIVSGLAGSRGQLMLKEHFRGMPEIIGFSNEHFYDGRLQPLRQYGSDRLEPLRSEYVADGMLEGRGQRQVNRAEAERLVERVVLCCSDPAYTGRTMGVVTLMGNAQQALVEDLLADRLSLEERMERHVRVGNPAAFQGDERDVMFLSAVYAPFDTDGEPRRAAPFSAEGYQQAVNVAASRARDQVWFFHSFALTELGETDLRRAYLDYLGRPAADQDGSGLGEIPADVRVEPFDSLFEQRVYRALREQGYRVRPQYPAGRYRIDLVVEGGTRRLAVECDGDAFHTEENASDDAARQRELERVGWTFVRIRGSRFFRDPGTALQPLWKQLERMDIQPV